MIADQVVVRNTHDWVEMEQWCKTYIGQRALFKDTVNQHNPWHLMWNISTATFSFSEAKYATLFRMRWG